MDLLQAKNRIRQVVLQSETASDADRDRRLRAEVRAILQQTPAGEQSELLEQLTATFPIWPPDVPPPPTPSDAEVVQTLRMRSDLDVTRAMLIEDLMRRARLGGGLSEEDVRKVAEKAGLPAGARSEVGRVVDACLAMLGAMTTLDQTARAFLQENNLGLMMAGTPKLRDAAVKLLALADDDPSRHSRLAEFRSACEQIDRVTAMMAHWPARFAADAAARFAPMNIEAVVPTKLMNRLNYEGIWQEYVNRCGGKDVERLRGEFIDLMKKAMT